MQDYEKYKHRSQRNFPGGFPWGMPGIPGIPGMPGIPGVPGGVPGPGGGSAPPPPSAQIVNQYQYLVQNPSQAQNMLQQGVGTYAVGCDNRWTIVLLRNGQLFLMYVTSASAFGNTTGWIWPAMTFGSFPSSSILFYSC